ncbi:DUF3703 domain-containing protein [Pseudoalteromonas sp. C2R02]|uniref:DUF3703 domain-containing protein n=1 Tax=Pseudoalteromonas sp. C2R02 TaxID=2841565 RepID=UPI001C087D1E|nr:DUF3703 domain-containing protein [Pseudoalteromonas sp. C2R02]MBU2972273.1 DUF3703 domain-containing protein [Pseudoalteromonas sp. C2R02]
MNTELKKAFAQEMLFAKKLYKAGDYIKCFGHLERAHILGQSYVISHTSSHWWMLKVGIKTINIKEVLGQVMRILASIVFSRIWVPLGNTGGTNVSPFKPMPIPKELKKHLENE